MMKLILICLGILALTGATPVGKQIKSALMNTANRIASQGYPVETHKVKTSDGYVLTMFRIPYSRKLGNQYKRRPVVFLQHGLLSSSDCWILNGPDNALAYLLADAGYDVWMGNARGNAYSKKNVRVSYLLPSFWEFSWNEIGLIDMPAMIDYTLLTSKEKSLHYVGHSQGTTVFFVLMSSMPSYNAKIKTSHMLAPVGYTNNMHSLGAGLMAPFLVNSIALNKLMGRSEFMPNNALISMLGAVSCANSSPFRSMCGNVLFLMGGWDSKHLNYTLLSDVAATHPAGSSSRQLIHYLQGFKSGHFRKYDFGLIGNMLRYNKLSPPDYEVENITAPVWLYYSDNDKFSAVADVQRIQEVLPNLKESFHVPIREWNHLDFLWALEVKEMINDRIIATADKYEQM